MAGKLFVEAKTKMEESKSITVKREWLEKAKEQALSMRKEDYAVAISFGEPKDYYIIEAAFMEDLYKSREALRSVIEGIGGLGNPVIDVEYEGNWLRKLIRRYI